jgi:hypothetical protein
MPLGKEALVRAQPFLRKAEGLLGNYLSPREAASGRVSSPSAKVPNRAPLVAVAVNSRWRGPRSAPGL